MDFGEELSFEKYLPTYLKNDIEALIKGYKENSTVIDCLYCEVQASINIAYYDDMVTKEQAHLLRMKYLGLGG